MTFLTHINQWTAAAILHNFKKILHSYFIVFDVYMHYFIENTCTYNHQ